MRRELLTFVENLSLSIPHLKFRVRMSTRPKHSKTCCYISKKWQSCFVWYTTNTTDKQYNLIFIEMSSAVCLDNWLVVWPVCAECCIWVVEFRLKCEGRKGREYSAYIWLQCKSYGILNGVFESIQEHIETSFNWCK